MTPLYINYPWYFNDTPTYITKSRSKCIIYANLTTNYILQHMYIHAASKTKRNWKADNNFKTEYQVVQLYVHSVIY